MSRNLRYKTNATPTKKKVRRSSTATEMSSSDDDYAGVDAISDSDEDEPDVEEAEEKAIIESEEDDDDIQSTPRPSIDDDQSSWDGFDMNTQEEILGENVPFFEEHIARMHAPDHDTEATVWNATNGFSDDEPDATRRVRFDLSDSTTTISDNEDGFFPDIFVDQSSLDPSFRKAIESSQDNDDYQGASSDEGSCWDFNGEEHDQEPLALVKRELDDEDNESVSSAGSSGYETDEGETTEEDLPPAAKYVGPGRSVLRRPSTDSGSEEEITIPRHASFRNRNGPRLGSWISDRTKPFVVMDNRVKKLIMYKAVISGRRFTFGGTSSQPQVGYAQESDVEAPAEQLSPMISNSANLMMSAMYTPIDHVLMGGQALGPPEAFFPFTSINSDGTILQDSPSSYDEDDIDDEDLWRIEDLLDFGTGGSVNGDAESDGMELCSTPARPTTAASEDQVYPLLANPHLVGAFRNNQDRHQLLSRNKASRESLAFSGPLNHGTLRGIKGNRLAAANTPMTPLRKQKGARANLISSPASPLVQAQNKRKFSGEQMSHKRSKSLI